MTAKILLSLLLFVFLIAVQAFNTQREKRKITEKKRLRGE